MRVLLAALAACVLALPLNADEAKPKPLDSALAQKAGAAMDKAVDFFRKSQNENGSFADAEFGPPITGLVVTSLLRSKRVTVDDPLVAKGLAYIGTFVQADGGIYAGNGQRNYATAICLMAFAEANKEKEYQRIIDGAVAFLKKDQWDESEGVGTDSPKYGGAGYGKKSRPDLSNTAFLLEALNAGGLSKDDPAYQRALVFVTRCQNFSGEGGNDLPFGAMVKDGGFFYTAAEDYNPGGGDMKQGLRSYGSMTYAGLKSFIHAGLSKDDPRVKAALGWVKHYTVSENPGIGQQGLYYYYHTFAKTLAVLKIDAFEDANGAKHDWRGDLIQSLLAKQSDNGSWLNPEKRWLKSDPRMVTALALLALGEATKQAGRIAIAGSIVNVRWLVR